MTQPPASTKESSPLLELRERLGLGLGHLTAALVDSRAERERLSRALQEDALVPADTAFVVFGSLGRGEWTSGSDLDWALLVDGQADPQHAAVVHRIRERLEALGARRPGTTDLFGVLAISHDLVHRIGGEFDTNRNITQRILLLLESRNVGDGEAVRERVLRVLLGQYLADDRGNRAPDDCKPRVPRFLLNDVVRYWRTIAVDFAAKRIARDGAGWGLRNLKLRMSRKLIFAAGFYACLSCKLSPPAGLDGPSANPVDFYSAVADFLLQYTRFTPLEILAQAVTEYKADKAATEIFESYDKFLGLLRNEEDRTRLNGLEANRAFLDELFLETRPIGETFESGLCRLFFDTNDTLTQAAQKYGVF